MIGRSLAHYRVTSAIGAGGMGAVYRATDTKLGRDVAIKVLSPEMAADPERLDRFRREARAVAALNHPHIVTIYSVEESDGIHFLTMELVEGRSLDHFIPKGGMKFDDILEITIQLTDALAAAHDKGIVHRDLKPANIMMGDKGRVKILDFGLAKIAASPLEANDSRVQTEMHTREGVVMGTAPYMSPEQISGKGIDHRTDLFSLGIILYEMATGQRPFQGTSSAELISSILRDHPKPLVELRSDFPAELSRMIRRCLEKDVQSRLQSARDLHNDLLMLRRDSGTQRKPVSGETERQMSTPSTEPEKPPRPLRARQGVIAAIVIGLALLIAILFQLQKKQPAPVQQSPVVTNQTRAKSIAVLPFVNEGGNPDDEYFSDGITDELASAFMKLPGLRVAARSSAFTFKGKGTGAREVGAKLNVTTVLEGTVRRSGSRIRVTVQLVNAEDGLAIWSERYEREAKDVFAVQDDITSSIVSALHLTLASPIDSASNTGKTGNIEAHDLYLRGRFLMLKQTEESLTKSLEYFDQALQKDPNYASAYAGIAFAWAYLADAALPPKEAYPKAKAAVVQALKLDPENAEARTMFAVIQWVYDWDVNAAKKELHDLLQSNPSSLDAHNFYGIILCSAKQFDEGLAEVDRAVALDPLNAWPGWMREYCLTMARRYDEVLKQQKKTKELDPYLYYLDSWVGVAYREKGMYAEAVDEYQRVQKLTGSPIPGLAVTYARMGKTAEAQKTLQDLLELSKRKYVAPEQIAVIYASIGDLDLAFEWMEKAYEAQTGAFPVIFLSPSFDPLRSDPRFTALLKRMHLQNGL